MGVWSEMTNALSPRAGAETGERISMCGRRRLAFRGIAQRKESRLFVNAVLGTPVDASWAPPGGFFRFQKARFSGVRVGGGPERASIATARKSP